MEDAINDIDFIQSAQPMHVFKRPGLSKSKVGFAGLGFCPKV
jgi:hypothetical protein